VHHTLPAREAVAQKLSPAPDLANLPKTPEEAAQRALAALDPTTEVTTSGAAVVAGRSAYELVLKPRQTASLVASVRISVDAQKHLPLRVQVYSTKLANPAFEVGFTSIDFARPEARQFAFNPPPGTTVTESDAKRPSGRPDATRPAQPTVVGKGWSAVAVGAVPKDAAASMQGSEQLTTLLQTLPKASGSWGSGHLLAGTLFSAVLTDDGRLAVGAVQPQNLYAALAAQ
jgi:hypothetical protein